MSVTHKVALTSSTRASYLCSYKDKGTPVITWGMSLKVVPENPEDLANATPSKKYGETIDKSC